MCVRECVTTRMLITHILCDRSVCTAIDAAHIDAAGVHSGKKEITHRVHTTDPTRQSSRVARRRATTDDRRVCRMGQDAVLVPHLRDHPLTSGGGLSQRVDLVMDTRKSLVLLSPHG